MKGNAGTIRRLNSADRRWFENFARVSGGWFWETDAEGRFVYMSDSVEEVTGIRPEWHYGKTRQDIGAPEAVSQAAWDAHLEQLRQHQPFDDFIFLRPGPDGGRWMKTSGMPVFGSDGAFQGYQGLAADITAQVSAEREAGLLADAIEQFSESFALWDADERLVICNGKFRDLNRAILDYTVPGTLFVDFLKAANRAGLVARAGALNSDNMTIEEWTEARLEKFRNPGQPFEMQRQNGTWLWVVEQRMADGAMVSSATDITQVKLAKQEQEAAHRRLQDAIEVLPGAFVLFDEDDTILVTNSIYRDWFAAPGVESLTGWTFERLMRDNVARGAHEVPADEIEDWLAERVAMHRNPGAENERHLSDGRWLRAVDSRTFDHGVVRVLIDITELKSQQEELDTALKHAEDANQAKSEFLATISHEIRTPLNGILGMAYLMRDATMEAPEKERLENIIVSGNALQGIINDVLDMSKIEAGVIEIENIPFDMSALVASVSSLFGDVAADKGLDFEIGPLPWDARHLVGDPARVRQVFWNLLSNAVKFTQKGGISVQFSRDPVTQTTTNDRVLRIVVRDSGIGIDNARLTNIFDPFVQADASTTRRFGGSGLGLSIIRHLVDLMGGSIGVESEPGNGSAFTVELPFGVAAEGEVERQNARRDPVPAGKRRPLRILVAEDHPLNALVTTELLQRQGHTTIHVENGSEAAAAVDGGNFDLILMDAHMPEMDGAEATRLIRAHPVHGGIPIIGLTADAFINQHATMREAGMNSIVTKPFTDNELTAAIWAHLPANAALLDSPAAADETMQEEPAADWRVEGQAKFQAFAKARDPAMVGQILELGRDMARAQMADLQAAVVGRDSERIRFVTHTLKGASGTLFACRLMELAAEMEQASEDLERVASLLPELELCVRETIEWWNELENGLGRDSA